MCGVGCSVVTLVVGAILVAASSIIGYVVVPQLIDSIVAKETSLINDTIQLERFKEIPFPLTFSIRVFNVTNSEAVLAGGVPHVREIGPYSYKLYQERVIEAMTEEVISYRFLNHYEFDAEASFPNTEDDLITMVNVPYNSVLQLAERMVPNLMGVLNQGLGSVFGIHNSPFMTVRVGNLIFDGIPLCQRPGIIGAVACLIIRDTAASVPNLDVQDDGSVIFSLFAHKNGKLSELYQVSRGLTDPREMGKIGEWNHLDFLPYWVENSPCSMLNGTDTNIYGPFVDRSQSIYAFNSDICRSVELRYQHETEYQDIPAVKFAINEWFLADEDGCFCINTTLGDTRPDGCLKYGAIEMYSCLGSYLVLTYPHFLFTHPDYTQMVIGQTPDLESHRIFLDVEPLTGTPLRGAKRAQLNVFLRALPGIPATASLHTTLTPAFWVEEAVTLPEEYVEELKTRLLDRLSTVNTVVPLLVALSGAVMLLGVAVTVRAMTRRRSNVAPVLNTIPVAT